MGLKVVITDALPQLAGEYDMEDDFLHSELHIIEKVSGKAALEVDDAIERGDTTVLLCLGVIGAIRAGKLPAWSWQAAVDELMKTKAGSVYLTSDEPEEVASPEVSAGPPEPGETQKSSSDSTKPPLDDRLEQTLAGTGALT